MSVIGLAVGIQLVQIVCNCDIEMDNALESSLLFWIIGFEGIVERLLLI
jgi:hypothetical protein